MNLRITPAQLAGTLKSARLNLIGVVEHLALVNTLVKDRDTKRPRAEIVPGGEVYKWQKTYFQALSDYEIAVINAQVKGGVQAPAFKSKGHSWAVPYDGSKIVKVHRDFPARPGFYLQVRCPHNLPVKVEYRDRMGRVLDREAIAGILPVKQPVEAVAAHQGVRVEDIVIIRDYGMENIIRLSYCGMVYEIITESLAAATASHAEAVAEAAKAVAEAEEAEEAARAASGAAAVAAAKAERAARRAAEKAVAATEAAEAEADAKVVAEAAARRAEAEAARIEAEAAPRPGTPAYAARAAKPAPEAVAKAVPEAVADQPADQPANP